jgi:hypothetical protein
MVVHVLVVDDDLRLVALFGVSGLDDFERILLRLKIGVLGFFATQLRKSLGKKEDRGESALVCTDLYALLE